MANHSESVKPTAEETVQECMNDRLSSVSSFQLSSPQPPPQPPSFEAFSEMDDSGKIDDDFFFSSPSSPLLATKSPQPSSVAPMMSEYLNDEQTRHKDALKSWLFKPLNVPPPRWHLSQISKDVLISGFDPMWNGAGSSGEVEISSGDDHNKNELPSPPSDLFSFDSNIDEYLSTFEFENEREQMEMEEEMEEQKKVMEPTKKVEPVEVMDSPIMLVVDEENDETLDDEPKAMKRLLDCYELKKAKELKRLTAIPLSVYARLRMTIVKVKKTV